MIQYNKDDCAKHKTHTKDFIPSAWFKFVLNTNVRAVRKAHIYVNHIFLRK